jgi:hypothetical protein
MKTAQKASYSFFCRALFRITVVFSVYQSVEPDHPEVAAAVREQLRFAAEEDSSAAAASSINRYSGNALYEQNVVVSVSRFCCSPHHVASSLHCTSACIVLSGEADYNVGKGGGALSQLVSSPTSSDIWPVS